MPQENKNNNKKGFLDFQHQLLVSMLMTNVHAHLHTLIFPLYVNMHTDAHTHANMHYICTHKLLPPICKHAYI